MKSPMNMSYRKAGSALLVVLGFLSFMVVSAVAFAIYMRTERVPSSALRRSVANRQLVRAAVAHAMSRVDDAIRDDPFPGLPYTNNNSTADYWCDKNGDAMDFWYGRVFMPPDPDGSAKEITTVKEGIKTMRFAPISETVSVLNLEGLGYLPPALVNDVRFLSRGSWTAHWQNFPYDAGRFAFCAVNVSDFFDINRVTANMRTSAPGSRISIAHLLRDSADDLSSISETTANNFSTLFGPDATARPEEAHVPYVSLLDYNLALWDKYGQGGLGNLGCSYFAKWVYPSGTKRFFYDKSGLTDDTVQKAARQVFVTDSWVTNETYEVDFATLDGQPFPDVDVSKEDQTIAQVARSTSSRFLKRMFDRGLLGMSDVFALYDYLDHDDLPLSLAMPSVECVPMVTAISAPVATKGLTVQDPVKEEQQDGDFNITLERFKPDPESFLRPRLRVLVSFPFRHAVGRNLDNFKVQAMVKFFVAAAGSVPLRPAGALATGLHPSDKAQWKNAWRENQNSAFEDNALVWTLCSNMQTIDVNDAPARQEDALKTVDLSFNGGAPAVNLPIFTKKTKQKVSGEQRVPQGSPIVTYLFDGLRPYGSDGNLALDPGKEYTDQEISALLEKYQVYAAVWVRVTDGTKTYDLAPAYAGDDGLNDTESSFGSLDGYKGTVPGLLKFQDDAAQFDYATLVMGNKNVAQNPPSFNYSLATVDPRFNFASEDWFKWTGQANVGGAEWLDRVYDDGYFDVSQSRDPDIFMFVSNQGYLQSLGEFAFLPRLSDSSTAGAAGTLLKMVPTSGGSDHVTDAKTILNNVCAWRTHTIDRTFYEDCAKEGIGRNTQYDQTVNPYTDNTEIMLAAIANTPWDYWVTGRTVAGLKDDQLKGDFKEIVKELGDDKQTSGDKIDKLSESLKHAFCEKSEDASARIETAKIKALAKVINNHFKARPGDNEQQRNSWEFAYDTMFLEDRASVNPDDENTFKNFLGLQLDHPLYSTDRKFLYSYWRDCFANKQQLFLIFARAESTALGGPGEGTPAQQGGRAVALVWRDPASNTTDGGNGVADDRNRQIDSVQNRRPHRMRVLFYHQFD